VRRRGGEAAQVRGGIIVQLQSSCQRLEDLLGGMPVASLLEPYVVLGADPGQDGDLRAAQPGDPAAAVETG
jgi:hypothetical protein